MLPRSQCVKKKVVVVVVMCIGALGVREWSRVVGAGVEEKEEEEEEDRVGQAEETRGGAGAGVVVRQ